MGTGTSERTFLALDTGSPVVSVGVATATRVLAEARSPEAESSELLLSLVDEVLASAAVGLHDIQGVCALQGPGSFTGLRVGLATVLGFHQSLGIPATAIPSLAALASLTAGTNVLAVVDALRDHWFQQLFRVRTDDTPKPLSEPAFGTVADLRLDAVDAVVGFKLAGLGALAAHGPRQIEPESLAGAAARLAARWSDWDPARLVAPLYLRPPPARPPPPTPGG